MDFISDIFTVYLYVMALLQKAKLIRHYNHRRVPNNHRYIFNFFELTMNPDARTALTVCELHVLSSLCNCLTQLEYSLA